MKRIIALILALIMCVAIFTGCGTKISEVEENAISITSRFVQISTDGSGLYRYHLVYVDKETGVMYWCISGIGLTVMVNADGTPMRYDLESHKIIESKCNE